MSAKRLQNWAIFLKAFIYTIKYIPSKNFADFLLKAPIDDSTDLDDIPTREIENSSLKAIQESQFASIDWKRIQIETRKDETLAVVTRFAVDGWPDHKPENQKLWPFYYRKNEIEIEQGCVHWGHRAVIPETLRGVILQELHASHVG